MIYPIKIILSSIYYASFNVLLVLFHPFQVIAHKIWGYKGQQGVVNTLNYLLIKCFVFLGAKVKFEGFESLPHNRPIILISNHQSTLDIPAIVVGFRKHNMKFISKVELAKGLPSISYNLRHGGSALIDRSKGASSIKEIHKLGERMEKNCWSACIFPEGTRSRDGKLKEFQVGGIKTLLRAAPSAIVIPFCIDGHGNLQSEGYFPLKHGCKLTYSVLEAIEPANLTAEEITAIAHERIKTKLNY